MGVCIYNRDTQPGHRNLHFDTAAQSEDNNNGTTRVIIFGVTLSCSLVFVSFMLVVIFYKPAWRARLARRTGIAWIAPHPRHQPADPHLSHGHNSKVISRDDLSEMFPSQDLPDSASQDEKEQLTCCICLEILDKGTKVRVLDCGHTFHSPCITSWLTKYKHRCPLCNHVIPRHPSPNPPEPAALH